MSSSESEYHPGVDLQPTAARGAETIRQAFGEHHRGLRAITQRVARRFEERDWEGIRRDTLEKLELPSWSVDETVEVLRGQLRGRLADRAVWAAMKEAYTRAILGRDDFEIAQTYFNSLTRKVFAHDGVDPAIDFTSDEFPLPFHGWEMASARLYAVHRIDAAVVCRMLEDAGFRAPFRDLAEDSALAAARLDQGIAEALGSPEIDALDVLRPLFFRNKGAYVVGRARRGERCVPVVLALVNRQEGITVDAVLHTEDETSVVFSFARWDFHVDVASPRQVIGFLRSILPRKRTPELYTALGYRKHGKTELYRDLMAHIAGGGDRFVPAPGASGLVMSVFTLPSYDFVFKVIKDAFPPQKNTTRERVKEKYRTVQLHDRVGRLVGFQEFEYLTFPRSRFAAELLAELLAAAPGTVSVHGEEVMVRHCYVERKVVPLDLYVQRTEPARAAAAVLDWGRCLKDLAAAGIFPGDVLLKNFGVTRHGRVLSYDYDELCALTDLSFRELPPPRDELEEMSAEPWFGVGEGDIFPAELLTFLGLQGELKEAFLREHGDLFGVELWRGLQERLRRGEVVSFYPYSEGRRLHPGVSDRMDAWSPAPS
ncbi:MAG: bifunctional isocitrate dehydrogenase kinase/phosphatase [Thermoanaerobaculia bacterium]